MHKNDAAREGKGAVPRTEASFATAVRRGHRDLCSYRELTSASLNAIRRRPVSEFADPVGGLRGIFAVGVGWRLAVLATCSESTLLISTIWMFVMRALLVILAQLASVAGAAAASPVGEWLVQDRTARVQIRPCRQNLCGAISWSADGKDLGRQILISMRPEGARWTGTVVDVRDGTNYLAHMSLQADGVLKIDGCVMGGVLCSGEAWTRFR